MDVDTAFQFLGKFGHLQKVNFVLFSMATMIAPLHMIGPALTVGQPDGYRCSSPPGFTTNDTVPKYYKEGEVVYDRCALYQVRNGSITADITTCLYGWEYQTTHGETSVVTDLNLVCDKGILGGTVQSIAHIGTLFGAPILGQMSDTYGRRKLLLLSLFGLGVCGTTSSFMWSYEWIAILFFTIGFWTGGVVTSSYVRAIEMFTTKRRMRGHMFNGIIYGLGVILVSPLAYLFPNWRHFQLAISIPCFILVPFIWFSFESVRWLVQKGRFREADKIIIKIAKSNKVPYTDFLNLADETKAIHLDDMDRQERDLEDKPNVDNSCSKMQNGHVKSSVSINNESTSNVRNRNRRYSVVHLFTTRVVATQTLILFLCWFSVNCVYFGLVINTSNIAGNKYLNFFLMALFELACYPIDFFVMKRFGRKRPLISYFVGSAVASIIVAFTPKETGRENLVPMIIIVSIIGRYCAAAVFNITLVVSVEVFPTVLRNIGLGTCIMVGRLGGVIAPFVVYLNEVNGWLPLTIFGSIAITASLLVSLLPETRHTRLPETVCDGVKLADKRQGKLECVPEHV